MPMIVVGTEKNFAALRPRLLEGKTSAAASRDVAAAVKAANPEVDLDRLEPGTVLNVPDAPNVAVRGDLSLDEATTQMLAGLAEAGSAALKELGAAARKRESAGAAERKKLAESLDGKEVAAATRKDKTLAAGVKATKEAIAEEDARAEARTAAFKQAQADWSKELTALKKILA
jgi:hypothetical protein